MKKQKPARVEDSVLPAIVERAKTGDRQAFGELIEKTQNRLYRFCFVLCGNKAQAEDLSQEAYLKAFNHIQDLGDTGAFIGWLFQISKNLFLDQVRSPSSQVGSLEDEHVESMEALPADWAEVLTIQKVLSHFEPEDRWLLLLIDLEEHSYKEAADLMKISEDAVRTRLFRIRKEFVERMKKA